MNKEFGKSSVEGSPGSARHRTAVRSQSSRSVGSSSRAGEHYRPDVDGLRALAVIPVILFHAGFGFMSGGFVGVDVFFVISGYLITGILDREIRDGRYSIVEFYRRRARRIFPALAVVTFITLIVGYLILTPAEYLEVGKSAVAVSLFSSNFYFWKSASYFDAGSTIRPLLHTWSLAVEEQYYVFFPLLLRLLHLRAARLPLILWVIAISSLVLAVALVPSKPSAAFYLLPTRAWELMVGGLLATGSIPSARTQVGALMRSAGGLMLIAVPMVAYSASTPFPGLAAVPPVLGTALVISASGSGFISKMLSAAIPVSIGKASYSIYLWHFPIFAFATYLVAADLSGVAAAALTVLSVVVGFVSLEFVERPFRSPQARLSRNQQAGLAAAGMAAAGLGAGVVAGFNGIPARMDRAAATLVSVQGDERRHHSECMTVDRNVVDPAKACVLGTPGTAPVALLWGDSHAMVTATAVEQAAKRKHASLLFAADADCPPGLGFSIDQRVNPALTNQLSYRYCATYNQRMLQRALGSHNIRTVILSSRWTNWRIGAPPNRAESFADVRLMDDAGRASSVKANEAKWQRGFLALVDRLTNAGKQVVIVGPLPEPTYNVPHRLYVQRFGLASYAEPITIAAYHERHAKILRFFEVMEHARGVTFVWPQQLLCRPSVCPVIEGDMPLYFDQDHLSVFGAEKTSPLYDHIFDKP